MVDGRFYVGFNVRTGWIHLVLNFIGPANGQGVQIYMNGVLTGSGMLKDAAVSYSPGDGRVVVGRSYTHQDQHYSTLEIDELISFNNWLNAEDVKMTYSK